MADNNNSLQSLINGINKFFGFLDKAFTIMDKQYANDGSTKFKMKTADGKHIVQVTCVPGDVSGNVDMQITTEDQVLDGQQQLEVVTGVPVKQVENKIKEVMVKWFGEDSMKKPEEEKKEDQSENQSDNSDQEENNGESSENDTEEAQPESIPPEPADTNDTNASKFIRFGLSKINGSQEIRLTKVFANYEPDLALNDLRTIIDDEMFDDLEGTHYYAVGCDDDDYEVFDTGDFLVENGDVLCDILEILYGISIESRLLRKRSSGDLKLQKFFTVDPVIDSMINYAEDLLITYDTEQSYFNPIVNCEGLSRLDEYTTYDSLYNIYVVNLRYICDELTLYMCNFDADAQNQFYSYINQFEKYFESVTEIELF